MVVVPTAGLSIEAKVLNRDADFVCEGQRVVVKVQAFPFTTTGTIPGRVLSISRDAVTDAYIGPYFLTRITLDQTLIMTEKGRIPLAAGLATTNDIAIGGRSIITCLVGSVKKVRQEADGNSESRTTGGNRPTRDRQLGSPSDRRILPFGVILPGRAIGASDPPRPIDRQRKSGMMIDTLTPPLLMMLIIVGFLLLRPYPHAAKMTFGLTVVTVIGAVLFYRGASPLPPPGLPPGIQSWWTRILAITWWIIAARATVAIAGIVLGHNIRTRQARLFTDLVSGAIWLTALIVILNSVLSLPVGGLLATSGIVAIVVGLALQSTLADLFSGIAVGLDQPFSPGDRVQIDKDIEGIVVQLNWRSIRIETDGEDIVTIPNSILAKSHIINRTMQSQRRLASVQIVTPSEPTESSADRVIELLRQAVMLCPGILEKPAPSVTLSRIGMRSNTYTVNYFVEGTPLMSSTRGHLLRQARRLFYHAGVEQARQLDPRQLLRNLVLFEALSTEQIEQLAERLKHHALSGGEPLYEQGDTSASLFIISAGVLEISRMPVGQSRSVIGRIGPGEYIGEISLLTGDPRPGTVTALTAVDAYELPSDAFKALLETTPELAPALERAVHRGLALLQRDDAARASLSGNDSHALLDRIRQFFHTHSRLAS